jgi:hypothetical protein
MSRRDWTLFVADMLEAPTTSNVVRLAVQLQQLDAHFLCDAQTDSVHPLQCSVA